MAFSVLPSHAQRQIASWREEITSALDANPDSAALRIVAPYKSSVDSVMAPVLGQSAVGMSGHRPESLLSNWAADVMVEASTFDGGTRADLGIINMGGLRSNMPKGTVRRGDIILISPFQNKLVVAYLLGSDLTSLMQDIAAVKGEGVSREVRLVISKDGQLLSATISGAPIDPQRTYRVATLDYVAEGNDKMYSFKKAQKVVTSDILAREAMMQSVQKAGTITSAIEGRITVQ